MISVISVCSCSNSLRKFGGARRAAESAPYHPSFAAAWGLGEFGSVMLPGIWILLAQVQNLREVQNCAGSVYNRAYL